MEPRPETDFPATLSRWVQEIVLSVLGPARSTLAEMVIGTMLAQGGPVTRAVLALTPRLGWQAYHWMLERGRFRLLGLVAALCGIVQRETCAPRRFAIIESEALAPSPAAWRSRCLSKELSGAYRVASLISRSLVSRSGLRQTLPTGDQFRIWRDHRVGLAARASA